ncbi:hypothetical protein HN51_030564 [Arachis hypogaea]|uniref:uncharacterized protein n=1 Tax=Arachis hypogaea TaxID=3818 RepID=UPI000DECCBD6|nr:uncharacterized protein LOC112714768 [Arachis hypogaea]QHO15057.1 uncharacterized protein DS421_10g291650 [Arachis hypogaea]
MAMENNYSYPSYPDSGDSSPRSREIDFENPPPWDDQQPPPNYKAKFMCSYGGKIQPRTHDNQLSYVAGETKILAVDLNIKFNAMIAKLSALCGCDPKDLSFKYQLPGEDLDALISVTNDDDLDHMMHEYDRLYRASARPARMRLFLFQANTTNTNSNNNLPPSSDNRLDPAQHDPLKPNPNVDYLFGLEKNTAVNVAPQQLQPPAPSPPAAPVPVKFHDTVPEPVPPPPEYQQRVAVNTPDRVIGSDPNLSHPLEVQRQFQRMQISESDQAAAYRRKSEEVLAGNYAPTGGDYYAQKAPPASAPLQPGYWPDKHVSSEAYHPAVSSAAGGGEPPVYVIPAHGAFYHHAPVVRPQTPPPTTQGYYAVQRMASDGYREAPLYGGVPPHKPPFSSAAPANMAPPQPLKGPGYTEGFGVVRPVGMQDNTGAAYAQVAYDSGSGRQVYYTAPGGGVVHAPPYQGVTQALTGGGVSLGQDGKVISKVSQGSV